MMSNQGLSRFEVMFLSACTLMCVGTVMSFNMLTAQGASSQGVMETLILRMVVGIVLIYGLSMMPLQWIRPLARPLMFLSIIALALLLIPGVARQMKGSQRWVSIAGTSIQISEFAKVFLILFLADFFARKHQVLSQGRHLGPPLIIVGLLVVLVMAQPDFGSATILLVLSFLMFYWVGRHMKTLFWLALSLLPALVFMVVTSPYRLKRVMGFLDPWSDFADSTYQLGTSLILIASGGLSGVGLGEGMARMSFLPESTTDFIFAVICEELGLAGGLAVMSLFALIAYFGFSVAMKIDSMFERLLLASLSTLIALQAALNVAVVCGAVPTKGLTLPFVSYGGSSLIASCLALGLALRVVRSYEAGEASEAQKTSSPALKLSL